MVRRPPLKGLVDSRIMAAASRVHRVACGFVLLALPGLAAGCLFTDPVFPTDDGENTPPVLGEPPSPSNETTVTLQLNTTPVGFNVIGTDAETTDRLELYYEWELDTLGTPAKGLDERRYQTSGQQLGAGDHTLRVIVFDPQGATDTVTWNILVQ